MLSCAKEDVVEVVRMQVMTPRAVGGELVENKMLVMMRGYAGDRASKGAQRRLSRVSTMMR